MQTVVPEIVVSILHQYFTEQYECAEVRNCHEGIEDVSHCPYSVKTDGRAKEHCNEEQPYIYL